MLLSCENKIKKNKNLPLKSKHNSVGVDRKRSEESFLQEQIISFVFVHYCLPISCKQ